MMIQGGSCPFAIFAKIAVMLLVPFIRNNKELVKERLTVKHFTDLQLVDEIIALDDRRKELKTDFDRNQAQVNAASKQIGELIRNGNLNEVEAIKGKVSVWKERIQACETELQKVSANLQDLLIRLPNLPHSSVPHGKKPEDNVVVREGGVRPELPQAAVPHWELAQKLDLIDFELGNKLTGSGFPVFKKRGAKLERALISYFLDFNTSEGYQEFLPPLMVNEATAYGTGQLPDKEDQMYQVQEDKFYLIPTAEVPLTNIYRDEMIAESDLPVKMTGYTPCFRREAGSYGKDVRGLNRVHQFDKVEIVQLVRPEHSYEVLENMVLHVEHLIQSLELPYRILRLCGGDMSFTSALTYDFEIYSAAQQRWLEVSSVSNFESFQTNRMKIRYKDSQGKIHLLHSLNGSSLALPRILACLLENFQDEHGVRLPKVLIPYAGMSRLDF